MSYQNNPSWNKSRSESAYKGGKNKAKLYVVPPVVRNFKLYKYENGLEVVDADLFDKQAKAIATTFSGISSTRMRRFFDSVKVISRKPDFESRFYEASLPAIKLLKSKCAYMVGRTDGKERNDLKNLKEFISNGVDQVTCAKDYQVFVSVFEAVYGFFYETAKKESHI